MIYNEKQSAELAYFSQKEWHWKPAWNHVPFQFKPLEMLVSGSIVNNCVWLLLKNWHCLIQLCGLRKCINAVNRISDHRPHTSGLFTSQKVHNELVWKRLPEKKTLMVFSLKIYMASNIFSL